MAKVVVTGATGFLGQLLIHNLLAVGSIRVLGQYQDIEQIIAVDLVSKMSAVVDPRLLVVTGNLQDILQDRPSIFLNSTVVFHLASAVSAECEIDFDLGLHANLITGMLLGNLLRKSKTHPTLVFASSLAVYGAEMGKELPSIIVDETRPNPRSSYGAQKLMLEIFFADIARRGELSVRNVRLMTVSIRPGRANGAASGFLSGIIREPLLGRSCEIPVPLDLNVCLNSPEQAVGGLIDSCGFPDEDWGAAIALNLPGLVVSIGEMVDALREVGGEKAVKHLKFVENAAIASIVRGWPAHFESNRAKELGFNNQLTFIEVVRAFAATKSNL